MNVLPIAIYTDHIISKTICYNFAKNFNQFHRNLFQRESSNNHTSKSNSPLTGKN